jgi:hypothetical protein
MSDTIARIHRTFVVGRPNSKARTGQDTMERYFYEIPSRGIQSQLYRSRDLCIQDLLIDLNHKPTE